MLGLCVIIIVHSSGLPDMLLLFMGHFHIIEATILTPIYAEVAICMQECRRRVIQAVSSLSHAEWRAF